MVHAAGVNPVDWKMRSGMMGGDLPQTTGREIAGVVDELGDGITDVAPGDKVGFAAGGGGAAELALLADYAPIPPSLDFAGAASLPVAVETAVRTLDLLGVGAGGTILVNGAAGAAGSAAVQIAHSRELAGGPKQVVTIADYAGAQETGARSSGGMGSERAVHALRE
jgi:NADPH:quinone reductase-like Zn-dependent oxidoreductase